MKKFLGRAFSLLLLASCATAANPMLSLRYNPQSSNPKTATKVAVVKPSYNAKGFVNNGQPSGAMAAIVNAQMEKYSPPDATVTAKYNNDYSTRIKNSMMGDLESILKAKGFVVAKTYDSFDEITYAEKKDVDLVVNPVFDFGPQVVNERRTLWLPIVGNFVTDTGSIKMIGKLKLEMIEPATNERIVIKNIDVGSFSIEAQYKNKEESETVAVDLINQMYPRLMDKLEKMIDVEEVSASLVDIKKLKAKAN